MSRIQPITLLAVWFAALYGALQIHNVPYNWGNGICGSWGCGPPTQALVAYHGFWFVFVTGPAGLALRTSTAVTVRNVGIALVAVGVLALLAILIQDLFSWLPTFAETIRIYSVERYLFRVTTLIDVPAVPLLLVGVVFWQVGRRRLLASEAADLAKASTRIPDDDRWDPPTGRPPVPQHVTDHETADHETLTT